MTRVRTGASPQDVLQGAKHVLFVEGTREGLDVGVLEELLRPLLRVEPLGKSLSVRSVALALRHHHPEYWFVVDRDDWSDEQVEASWRNFPDPACDNLLIWRRKELESYFLEPQWACRSRYAKPTATAEAVGAWIAQQADGRLWLEAANRVLVRIRNEVKHKQPGVGLLKLGDVQGCGRDQVLDKLLGSPLLSSLRASMEVAVSEPQIRTAFAEQVAILSDGVQPLVWGTGRWRDLFGAKAIFRGMINQWFLVPDLSKPTGARLTGQAAERAVAVDLLRHHQDAMPSDFRGLEGIMKRLLAK